LFCLKLGFSMGLSFRSYFSFYYFFGIDWNSVDYNQRRLEGQEMTTTDFSI